MNSNVFSGTTAELYRTVMTAVRDTLGDRSWLEVTSDLFVGLGLLVVGAITSYVVLATLYLTVLGWLL